MKKNSLFALPLAMMWIILTDQHNVPSFILGYIFSLGVLYLAFRNRENDEVNLVKIPSQLFWLGVYAAILTRDIILSGIEVTRFVLDPKMPISPGIKAITTQDETKNPVIAALSAHSITITPGELVVDYEWGDESIMYVHALNLPGCVNQLDIDQANRLKLFKRILGDD